MSFIHMCIGVAFGFVACYFLAKQERRAAKKAAYIPLTVRFGTGRNLPSASEYWKN